MFGLGFSEIGFGEIAGPLTTSPVLEDSYHQPFSEPTRYRMRPALAVALIAWQGFSIDPVALTRPEVVTADRWVPAFSEPVRFRRALPTSAQQFAAFVKADPFPERVTADRWVPPFSEPTRFLVRPSVAVARYAWSGFSIDPVALTRPESVTADRWVPPLSEPVRFRPRLATGAQQFAAFVKADRFPSTAEDLWVPPFSEPVRFRRALPTAAQQFAAFVKAAPFPEAVTADRWVPPLCEPVRFPRRLVTGAQQFAAYNVWPDVAERYRWQPPFSEPVRFRRALRIDAQQFAAFVKSTPFPEAVTADRWVPPFAEPVRFRRALPTRAQQHLAWSEWPVVLEVFTFALVGEATLELAPTSDFMIMLADVRVEMVFSAELKPWAVSDREDEA